MTRNSLNILFNCVLLKNWTLPISFKSPILNSLVWLSVVILPLLKLECAVENQSIPKKYPFFFKLFLTSSIVCLVAFSLLWVIDPLSKIKSNLSLNISDLVKSAQIKLLRYLGNFFFCISTALLLPSIDLYGILFLIKNSEFGPVPEPISKTLRFLIFFCLMYL